MGTVPVGSAKVIRDENGVPHIEAESEQALWYAMGHEHARDALFAIQAQVMRVRGQSVTHLEGFAPVHDLLVNDFAVHALKTYETDDAAIAEILSLPPGWDGPFDQLYENLRCYVDGLNDLRAKVASGQVEQQTKQWLDDESLEWVYENVITLGDVASWGAWLKGAVQFALTYTYDPTFVQNQVPFQSLPLGAEAPTFAPPQPAPSSPEDLFEIFGSAGATGSNSMAWTSDYVTDGATGLSGCVADPHGGMRSGVTFPGAPVGPHPSEPAWYCHLKCKGSSSSLDAFGYVLPASGVFFSFHNRDVAFGGSAAAANVADLVILRFRASPVSCTPPTYQYYDYYLKDWRDFEAIVLDELHEEEAQRRMLRAGPFGFVFHVPYGEEDPPGTFYVQMEGAQDPATWWDPAKPKSELFSAVEQDGFEEAIIAHRLPADRAVDANLHHRRTAVGLYRMMHAGSVEQIVEIINDLEASYVVHFCAADRFGKVFATTNAAIPRRGDDGAIAARLPPGHATVGNFKALLYGKASLNDKAVPARQDEDRRFDWRFVREPYEDANNPEGEVRYLQAALDDGGQPGPGYLPYVLFDPDDPDDPADPADPKQGSSHPPRKDVQEGEPKDSYENPGFVTRSNDEIWHAYKKQAAKDPGVPFQNQVFANVVAAGTGYHLYDLSFSAKTKSKNFIERFADVKLFLDGVGGGSPPFSEADAEEVAVSTRLYADPEYAGPEGTGPIDPSDPTFPVAVRQLREVVREIGTWADEAARELRFFDRLWQRLFDPPPGSTWEAYTFELEDGSQETVSLRDLWVNNTLGKVFWFPAALGGAAAELAMPARSALIDFLWHETRFPGWKWAADGTGGLKGAERRALIGLLHVLEEWDAAEHPFAMDGSSAAAGLLAQFRLGFEASTYETGWRWTPLFGKRTGAGLVASVAVLNTTIDNDPDLDSIVYSPLTASGSIDSGTQPLILKYDPKAPGVVSTVPPGPKPPSGRPGSTRQLAGSIPLDVYYSYRGLRGIAFPKSSLTSLLGSTSEHPISAIPSPDLDLLLDDDDELPLNPTPAQINEITRFFLALGGWITDGDIATSTKHLFNNLSTAGLLEFLGSYSLTFPLPRGLARVAIVRRLLDAASFLEQNVADPLPSLGEVFRARAHDLQGAMHFPETRDGEPADGEAIRRVSLLPDVEEVEDWPVDVKAASDEGFQSRAWAAGGSNRPMLTLFPKSSPGEENPPAPRSRFWNAPGQRQLSLDSPHHVGDLMAAYAANKLCDTHYDDYESAPRSAEFPDDIELPEP